MSDRTKQLFNFFSPALAIAIAADTCGRVSTEIKEEVEAEDEKVQKTAEEKFRQDFNTALARFSGDVKELKEGVLSLDIPERVRVQLIQRLAKIDDFNCQFFHLVEV